MIGGLEHLEEKFVTVHSLALKKKIPKLNREKCSIIIASLLFAEVVVCSIGIVITASYKSDYLVVSSFTSCGVIAITVLAYFCLRPEGNSADSPPPEAPRETRINPPAYQFNEVLHVEH